MIESLQEMLDKEPYESFAIVTTSGDRYLVENPHLVSLGKTQLHYFFPRSDRWVYIRLNQIAALESAQKAA